MEQLPVLDLKAAFDRAFENANMGRNGPQDPTLCHIIHDGYLTDPVADRYSLYYWSDSAHEGYVLYVYNQPARVIMCSEWIYLDFNEDTARVASDELFAFLEKFDDPKNLTDDNMREFIAMFDSEFEGA